MAYERDFDIDISGVTKRRPPPKAKHDPLEDMLRMASAAAPAVGTGIGALVGGPAGAMAGGAIGSGVGALGMGGADMMGRDEEEAARRRQAEEDEQAAQHRAALSMLGGF